MLNINILTSPPTSTRTSIPNDWTLGLKKFESKYKAMLGVGVAVNDPVGVKVGVIVGVKVIVGVSVIVKVLVIVGLKVGV